jgi:ribosomal protein L10
MSKYVKNLIASDLSQRLDGVQEAVFVNVIGLDANQSVGLRKDLREKNIKLLVVKNSLAKRATEGTPLATAMQSTEGSLAIMWGADDIDIVTLAKEAMRLDADKNMEAFKTRGGVMGEEPLSAERVKEISKWPSREEQVSILVGQLLGPGGNLAAALVAPGGALASQIEQKSKDGD